MASVEDKIVSMKFDNKQFEPNAQKTMSTLDRLKAALNFGGAGKGLTDLQNTANRFSLSGLGTAAAGIGGKFSAMSVAAIAAIASITAKAVDAGIKIANAFTLKPIKAGFDEYELKMGSIQTILANTARYGTKLPEVTRNLDELNAYADKTIYNFGDMTKNIGLFTNAGIRVGDATSMIKGFSNEAAASGTSAQGAASAAYQLSQALSAGTIRLMDWRSLQNVGMGNKNMQNGLIELADSMGTLEKAGISATDVQKDFNGSLEKKWLSADVMSKYLKIMAGDLSVAEQKSLGLTDAQIKMFKAQQKNAEEAATKVRTFTQLTGTIAESVGSGWAETFNLLIGDFNQATALWTGVNETLGGMIGKWGDARNKLVKDWADAGGRTDLIKSFSNIFDAVMSIAKPIKEAFRDIFPATTGKQLAELTASFRAFTETLKIGSTTAGLLKRSFAGFFAIFSIGWSLIKALASVLGDLFGVVSDGSGSFLGVTASVGDWLVALDKAIKKGDVFGKFFDKLGSIFKNVIGFVKQVAAAFADMFNGFKVGGIGEAFGRITDRLAPLASAGDLVSKAWDKLMGLLGRTGEILAPLGEAIGAALTGIGDAIAKAFKAGDFSSVFDALNTGLLTGIVLLIKKFLGDGLKIDFGGGLGASIKETFGALTSTLTAMQTQIQAKTLLTIAAAIGILTVSVVALSLIDSAALTKSLTAMAVAFGQLMVSMAILTKISAAGGFAKIPVIAAGMVLLASAVLILTAAVRNLSGLSWEELAKGLLGVGALLAMIVGVSMGLQKSSGSMLRAGLAMIPLAIGLKILASAVKDFAEMSFGEIGKGLLTIAGAMVAIAIGMSLMPPSMLLTAAGLVLVGVALKIIASALADMGGMSWGEIAKSLVVLAGALLILAGGLYLMTAALPGAAALVVVAFALAILAPVLLLMATMSWEEIGKGMVVLAGSLLILAGGLYLMTGAAAGAAALVVVAVALGILAPILILLGSMPWQTIAMGLAALAAIFLVIGVAGLLLAPIIPLILGLGAALLLLGVAVALIGVGLLAIATAFSIFVAAATAGVAVVVGMINLIPQFMTKFAEGIGAFAVTIANQAGKFTRAFASLLTSILDAIIQVAPKIGQAFNVLMATLLNILVTNIPKIAAAGVKLVLGLMDAIISKMPALVTTGTKLIVAFLTEVGKQVPKIAKAGTDLIVKLIEAIGKSQAKLLTAGAKLIVSFINKLAETIRANQSDMEAAGANLADAIVDGMISGLTSGARWIAEKAASVAKSALNAAKSVLGIKSPSKEFFKLGVWSDEGMANGFSAAAGMVRSAAVKVSNTALDAVKKSMSNVSSLISDETNLNPTVTPILDLSKISADAERMNKLIGSTKIDAQSSYSQASSIANQRQVQASEASSIEPATKTPVQFTQNNYSPKVLDPIEVYRNTKNQLTQAKELLST